MLKTIDKIYRKIPNSYGKSLLKNLISFTLHAFAFQIETIKVSGEAIRLYKDITFSNNILAAEVEGYNQIYKLQPGDIVIDGGAYTGMFSIFAAKKVGKNGKVFAYEPDPYNRIILMRNLKLNNISNVKVVQKGLFDKKGTIGFDIQGVSSTIVNNHNKFLKTINKISVTTIDNEIKRLKLKKLNFVKMDIEGAEIEAIIGAKNTIKTHKEVNFAIASYHIVNNQQTKNFLEEYFKKNKMWYKTGYKKHLTTYASRKV